MPQLQVALQVCQRREARFAIIAVAIRNAKAVISDNHTSHCRMLTMEWCLPLYETACRRRMELPADFVKGPNGDGPWHKPPGSAVSRVSNSDQLR